MFFFVRFFKMQHFAKFSCAKSLDIATADCIKGVREGEELTQEVKKKKGSETSE